MNKYEEAVKKIEEYEIDLKSWLAFVTTHIKDNQGTITIGDILDGNLSDEWLNLVTLVERATPMKPNGTFGDECPMCHINVVDAEYNYKFNFCHKCGQALDWSGEPK